MQSKATLQEECQRSLDLLEKMRHLYTPEELKERQKKVMDAFTDNLLSAAKPQTPGSEEVQKLMIKHLTYDQDLKLYPWMQHKEEAEGRQQEIENNLGKANALEELRSQFKMRAKSKKLSPLVVLAGHYLLYSSKVENAAHILMYMLLHFSTAECVATHNWYVASLWDQGTVRSRGAHIARMEYPLFPAPLTDLNSEMLQEQAAVTEQMDGGGEHPLHRFYKKPDGDILYGGGYLAVYDAQGAQIGVGDLSDVENRLNEYAAMVQGQMEKMTKQIRDAKRVANQSQAVSRGYGQRGGYQGYGGRGRGNYRGSYRGYYRGGSMEEEELDPETTAPRTIPKNGNGAAM